MNRRALLPSVLARAIGWTLLLVAPIDSTQAAEVASFFELEKIRAPDGTFPDLFGSAVAADRDTMVIGAPTDDEVEPQSGSAYIYQRDFIGPHPWLLVAKITASDPQENAFFGTAVAVAGDTIVVGASFDDGLGFLNGAAYIFQRGVGGPGDWSQVAKIAADDGATSDRFGGSVGLSGDTAAVGATSAGSVYVFDRDFGGADVWGQVAKLSPEDGSRRVAIAGDTLAVGAPFGDDGDLVTGAALIFQRDVGGPNAWGQVAKLTPDDGEEFDLFGYAVSITDDTLAVGSALNDESGSAYLFRRDVGGADAWGQVAKIAPRDGRDGDEFGESLFLSGDTLVVGAYRDDDRGSAYIYRRDFAGPEAWGQLAKITADDRHDHDAFGVAVSVSGDTVVIGASGDNEGSAYVFRETTIDPFLEIVGRCPGEVTLTSSGTTPSGDLEMWAGTAEGSFNLTSGLCTGIDLGLENARRLRSNRADPDGTKTHTRTVRDLHCGLFLQLVDMTACATSAVIPTP